MLAIVAQMVEYVTLLILGERIGNFSLEKAARHDWEQTKVLPGLVLTLAVSPQSRVRG